MALAFLLTAAEVSTTAKIFGGVAALGLFVLVAGSIDGEPGCLPVGGLMILVGIVGFLVAE